MTRRRGLTPEEEALWRRTVRDVAPYGRSQKAPAENLVSEKKGRKAQTGVGTVNRAVLLSGAKLAAPLSRRAQHPFAAGDPRLDRLAGRGRLAIDGVLDLHGHSQRTARGALGRFLADQHASGARCVLVITGKGAAATSSDTHAEYGAGRGVLRARFSDWLAEAPLRDLISRASQAHPRHGGAGAFYVFLKR